MPLASSSQHNASGKPGKGAGQNRTSHRPKAEQGAARWSMPAGVPTQRSHRAQPIWRRCGILRRRSDHHLCCLVCRFAACGCSLVLLLLLLLNCPIVCDSEHQSRSPLKSLPFFLIVSFFPLFLFLFFLFLLSHLPLPQFSFFVCLCSPTNKSKHKHLPSCGQAAAVRYFPHLLPAPATGLEHLRVVLPPTTGAYTVLSRSVYGPLFFFSSSLSSNDALTHPPKRHNSGPAASLVTFASLLINTLFAKHCFNMPGVDAVPQAADDTRGESSLLYLYCPKFLSCSPRTTILPFNSFANTRRTAPPPCFAT